MPLTSSIIRQCQAQPTIHQIIGPNFKTRYAHFLANYIRTSLHDGTRVQRNCPQCITANEQRTSNLSWMARQLMHLYFRTANIYKCLPFAPRKRAKYSKKSEMSTKLFVFTIRIIKGV